MPHYCDMAPDDPVHALYHNTEYGFPARGDDVLFERMEARRVCKECGATYHLVFKKPVVEGVCDKCSGELYQRADDTLESVKRRLEIYETKTKPLLDYYDKKGILYNINGMQSFDKVYADIELVLRDL